jgi:hypothetical protein
MVVCIFWRGKVEATARNGSETHHGIQMVLVVDCFGSAACTSFGCVLVPQKEPSDLSVEFQCVWVRVRGIPCYRYSAGNLHRTAPHDTYILHPLRFLAPQHEKSVTLFRCASKRQRSLLCGHFWERGRKTAPGRTSYTCGAIFGCAA